MKITKQQVKQLIKEQLEEVRKISIVVLDDGETYSGEGYLVYLTQEEYDKVEDGYKVSSVVDLDPDTNPNVKAI